MALYLKTKDEVGYHLTVGRDRCGVCAHFLPPHRCEKVSGAVQRNGWCELFERKPKPREEMRKAA